MKSDRPSVPPQLSSRVHLAKLLRCVLLPALLACTAGCSLLGPFEGQPPEPAVEPVMQTVVEAPAPITAEPAPVQTAREPLAPVPRGPARILVLSSGDASTYRSVRQALGALLDDRYVVHVASVADVTANAVDATADAGLLAGQDGPWTAAVAIGADAARLIGSRLDVPTVFCQVFDYEPLLVAHPLLFGIEAMPPLELQLESWKRIAADASTVGVIVGKEEVELVAAARQVAAGLGIELEPIVAESDREALYQFKRVAQSIDGIWLLPNSEILSPHALEEILDYALAHRVHSIVFNPTLLESGALLSVAGDPNDVAAAAARVLHMLVDGDLSELRRMTPLTTVDAELNPGVATALGISSTKAVAALSSGRADGT